MKLLLLVCKCKLSKSFPLPIFHMRQWLKTANLVSWRHTVGLTGHHLLGSIWHITHNLGKYRTGLHCYCSHKGERWQGEFMRFSSDGSQKQIKHPTCNKSKWQMTIFFLNVFERYQSQPNMGIAIPHYIIRWQIWHQVYFIRL